MTAGIRCAGKKKYLEPVPRDLAYFKQCLLPDGKVVRISKKKFRRFAFYGKLSIGAERHESHETRPMPNSQASAVLRYLRKVTAADYALNLPDQELLERFVTRRDEAAFAALVCRHGPMVLRLCQRVLQHQEDAEDAFEATFLVLCQKAASLRPQKSLAGWLHSVAYRIAQKARVAAARRRKHEGRSADRQAIDPLAEITLREAHEILDQELLRLPDKFRAPLVLCYLEGLTREEAAQQLGWPTSTLKSRLEEARERLRRRLAARGLALSGALVASLFYEGTASGAVPSALLDSTVRAATLVAAGDAAAAGVVSAEVAALAKGVMKGMFISKLYKMTTAVVLALGLAGAGVGVAVHRALADGAPVAAVAPADEAAAPSAAADEQKPGEGNKPQDGQKPREVDKPRDGQKPREADKPRDGERPAAKGETVTLTGTVSKTETKRKRDDGSALTVITYILTEENGNKVQFPAPREGDAGRPGGKFNPADLVGKRVTVSGQAVTAPVREGAATKRVVRLLTITDIKEQKKP